MYAMLNMRSLNHTDKLIDSLWKRLLLCLLHGIQALTDITLSIMYHKMEFPLRGAPLDIQGELVCLHLVVGWLKLDFLLISWAKLFCTC